MKKIWFILCILLLVPVYGVEVPFSEVVDLETSEDYYNLEEPVTIYVKEDGMYNPETKIVSVNIAPQEACDYQGTTLKDFFCDIFVSIVITTTDGETSKEFQSYLNFEIAKQRLFWDHAGYTRADRAGEELSQDTPLTVADKDIEVTLTLTHLTPSEYSCGHCETDAPTYINFLDVLRFRLEINYTQSQKDAIEEMQEDMEKYGDAQEYVIAAQQYFQQQEFKKAKDEYQKAKDLFDQTGDTENADEMQERIDECTSYDVATENFKEGVDLFIEAGYTNDSQEAIQKYEEARSYFQRAKTEFDYLKDTNQSDECKRQIDQCNEEIDNLKDVGTLRERLIYIILAIVVIAGAGIVIKQLGKGKAPKPETAAAAKGKRITLTVQNAETGQRIPLHVEATDKIGKVRQLAATNLGVIPSALLYKGNVCPPDWTVQECGLTDGATVEVVPKGTEPQPKDDRTEKLEKLEKRYREGKISRELYESLKQRLEKE